MNLPLLFTIILLITLPVVVATKNTNTYPWPDDVTQHSGYITVNKTLGNHFFYWFFESRSNPSQDPLILWLTGGPGCSSCVALLAENGPFLMSNGAKAPVYNKYSWNSFANLLYVDQPIGAGFSYSDSPLGIETNETTIARELTVFLEEFYLQYSEYAKLPLYIIGESYGGHYVPSFSAYILKNSPTISANLKGMGLGNGWVDPKHQYPSYSDFMFHIGYINEYQYNELNVLRDVCINLINSHSVLATNSCGFYFESVLGNAEFNLARTVNIYDVRIPCKVAPLCYDFRNIDNFLNSPDVQTALGVSRSWTECSQRAETALNRDWLNAFETDVALTLEKGVRVLVYNGKVDFICNYMGGFAWTSEMNWPGKTQFNAKNLTDWELNGEKVGEFRSFGNLTYLGVEGAGHMAPMDKPEVTLQMLQLFLSDKPFEEENHFRGLKSIHA